MHPDELTAGSAPAAPKARPAPPTAPVPVRPTLWERARALAQWVGWPPLAPLPTLGVLLVLSLSLRLLWLPYPMDSLIFDEKYYVNAARVILGLPVAPADAPYRDDTPGLDPNKEHPPLGKLIIALSMRWLGNNTFAWRLPATILGTFAIACLYGLACALGAEPWLAVFCAFIFAFDNLVFVHSRIGTLDILVVSFMLAGSWAYVAGRPWLGGLGLAISSLGKVVGLYGWLALVAYELGLLAVRAWHYLRHDADIEDEVDLAPGERLTLRLMALRVISAAWREVRGPLARLAVMSVVLFVAFFALLGAMDHRWSSFKNPFEHFRHIVTYAVNLTRASGPSFDESYPWQWLANDNQMPYLRVDTEVKVGDEVKEKRPIIFFRGGMNPFVVAMTPLAIASAIYLAFAGGERLAIFALALFGATYLPNYPPVFTIHRIEYIYYFLLSIPAVALATGHMLRRYKLPQFFAWAYVVAVIIGYFDYFPFRPYL